MGAAPLCPILPQCDGTRRSTRQAELAEARSAKEFFWLARQPFRAHLRYTLQARAGQSRPPEQEPPPSAAARQETGRQAEPLLQLLGRATLPAALSHDHAGDGRGAVRGTLLVTCRAASNSAAISRNERRRPLTG